MPGWSEAELRLIRAAHGLQASPFAACTAKYSRSTYLPEMTGERARAATVRIRPAQAG